MTLLAALIALFTAAAISPGQNVGIDGLQGLGDTRHHVVAAESLDKRYELLVGLPEGYDSSADTEYPTIYILDGGELYPLLRSYHRYLRLGGEAPEMILVAISYGSSDYENGNDRSHDYTAPSDEREYWGGAEEFQDFLGSELLPFIESTYRSRSDRRIIFGQSIGGQFILYTALTQPTLFWGHIASNPALHRNLPFFLRLHAETPPADRGSHLYVGSGSEDDPRFREPAMEWISHWTGLKEKPWRLRAETLDGHSHFSAPPASFRRGILWLFADSAT
ncbi:MAG: alpha/beta hydrolase-fold protein [Gammaproteobacteria bacterium]|nr:alpha/beta hydrolase-fold protein [Gammaproteobacteria bacterium]MDH3432931.1 alpha/beta hydrolase-fold protein [Gammaproteobacteria bacterium]